MSPPPRLWLHPPPDTNGLLRTEGEPPQALGCDRALLSSNSWQEVSGLYDTGTRYDFMRASCPRPTPISGKCPEGIHSLGIPSKDAGWLNGLSTNSSWIKIVEKKKKPQIVFSTIDLTVF